MRNGRGEEAEHRASRQHRPVWRRALVGDAELRVLSCGDDVADQRAGNVHVHAGVDEASFVAMRNRRDATLSAPALLLPAIQVNMHAGHWPEAEANGVPPDLCEALWRQMIGWFIQYEEEKLRDKLEAKAKE